MTSDAIASRLLALEHFGIKLGLDNISTLLDALDRPHHAFLAVHIGGTNGKGSVSAMVERALRHAGYSTGRYTSPHLNRLEERMAIDGEPIDRRTFETITSDVFGAVDRLVARGALGALPTFFEVTTAVAFEAFRRARVDIGVIEVGLGGRFDATNVIMPAATAITSIALDHERHLGATLGSIAFEKAGILKPGVPAIVGNIEDEPLRVIQEVADRVGAPVVRADARLLRDVAITRGRATIDLATPARAYSNVRLALDGAHQVDNALVAVRTLETLADRGLCIPAASIVSGLQDATWPARLEWLRLPSGRLVLIDAAHNPAGANALAAYLQQRGAAPLPLVISIMKDKDVDGIVCALVPCLSRCVVTAAAAARAIAPGELAVHIQRVAPALPVEVEPDPDAAVGRALAGDDRAVAAGSIFLVGPLRARLLAAGAVSLQGR